MCQKTCSNNLIQKTNRKLKKTGKLDKKTAKIGQACVQLYKTKIPGLIEKHLMNELSKVNCHMHRFIKILKKNPL